MNNKNSIISEKIYYKYLIILFVLVIISVCYIIFLPDYSHHIVLMIGLGLIFVGLYLLFPYYYSRKWVNSTAKIISIDEKWREVPISEYTKIKYFFPEIKFQYKVNGETFESDRVSYNVKSIWVPEVDVWGSKTPEEMKFWSNWSVGSVIGIFVEPNRNNSAIIINKLSTKILLNYISIIIAGLVLIFIWFYL